MTDQQLVKASKRSARTPMWIKQRKLNKAVDKVNKLFGA